MVRQGIGLEEIIGSRLPKTRHWAIHLKLGKFRNPIPRKALPHGILPRSPVQPGEEQMIVHERMSIEHRPESNQSESSQAKKNFPALERIRSQMSSGW
jgi:hypothetical protein